ncbi:hypothetical protein [Pseudoduganella sp. RAF53_2]|uniref:hypothetical protein n=1 Tax=unclassified Pseudoduganella TaxID=2637179 RepID=UPI003F9BCED4
MENNDKALTAINATLMAIHQEIAAIREERKRDIDPLRNEFTLSINQLRTEFHHEINQLRTEFNHAIDLMREEHNRSLRWIVGVVIANMMMNAGILARMAHVI